jgi:hypothetical protein
LDTLTGVYQGGPLSGKVFHANTIAVSKDPVALDAYLLQMINRARKQKGLSEIRTIDGRTLEGHPNASFLRIASENHELGSLSQDNIQSFDLSSGSVEYKLPSLQNSQSLLSEVKRTNDSYQVHVLMDNSKRTHTIESRIENMRGKVIRSFLTQSTISAQTTLEWDHKNDDNTTAKEGVYIWYILVDGVLHNCTINDFYSV